MVVPPSPCLIRCLPVSLCPPNPGGREQEGLRQPRGWATEEVKGHMTQREEGKGTLPGHLPHHSCPSARVSWAFHLLHPV